MELLLRIGVVPNPDRGFGGRKLEAEVPRLILGAWRGFWMPRDCGTLGGPGSA